MRKNMTNGQEKSQIFHAAPRGEGIMSTILPHTHTHTHTHTPNVVASFSCLPRASLHLMMTNVITHFSVSPGQRVERKSLLCRLGGVETSGQSYWLQSTLLGEPWPAQTKAHANTHHRLRDWWFEPGILLWSACAVTLTSHVPTVLLSPDQWKTAVRSSYNRLRIGQRVSWSGNMINYRTVIACKAKFSFL